VVEEMIRDIYLEKSIDLQVVRTKRLAIGDFCTPDVSEHLEIAHDLDVFESSHAFR